MSEFNSQYLAKETRENLSDVNRYISKQLAGQDWFFRSVADQKAVQKGNMSFSVYIKKYGIRADKDYELTCPRWHEIPKTIKERIKDYSGGNTNQEIAIDVNSNIKKIIDTSIQLQLLRSEAKRKALIFIDYLRKKILERTKGLTNSNQLPKSIKQNKSPTKKKKGNLLDVPLAGRGMGVSQGIVVGIAKNILNNEVNITIGAIGIFPNASPEFAILYPKCTGMIFLKGGQTSHGAIVAREFGIPALIDHKGEKIKDGTRITINGSTGEWNTLV